MKNDYVKAVAGVILDQLLLNKMELYAWGAQSFRFLEREHNGMKCPALMFSIRTPKVKRGGKVIISLNEGADTYIVEAIRTHSGKETVLGKKKDIFFDELHDTINSLIEDKETYTQVYF